MKKIFLLLIILAFGSCFQKKEFSLLGKWKLEKKIGYNDGKLYQKEIKNGEVIIFKENNIAIDGLGNKGTYEIKGDNLHICLPQNEKFYKIHHLKHVPDEMLLTPLTSEYKIIRDAIYELKYKKI